MPSEHLMERECIELAGKSFFEHKKKEILTLYGEDAWEKMLPNIWSNVTANTRMVTNTTPNDKEINDIKKIFACLFARGDTVISVNRAEEITLDVMGNLIAESDEFTKMMQLYMIISSKKEVGLYPKVFHITNPDFTIVPDFHKMEAMDEFVKSKGHVPRMYDSARQYFSYEYHDKKTGNIIDCLIHFYV